MNESATQFAIVAISPKGNEMVTSVHSSEAAAQEELERQVERHGGIWSFVIRRVAVAA